MIEVGTFKGKTVGVFGLARSGLSAVRALEAGGAMVFAWDDKDSARTAAEEAGAHVETFDGWPWREIKTLILSPGVPLTHPSPHPVVRRARAVGADVVGDVELFAGAVR